MFNEKIDRLGLIVGSGNLPISIIEQCKEKKYNTFCYIDKGFCKWRRL